MRSKWIGPIIISIATIAMLIWSWGTWPDALVDYGAQLYYPWRMTAGQVLYRDIAFFNGPLSQYYHKLLFLIFAVSLRTLVFSNLLIIAAVIVLIYRLTIRLTNAIAATMAGLTFVLIFAFGQGVGVGNFNWVTPYTQEITHGIFLGLLCLECLLWKRGGSFSCHLLVGLLLGLTFLTKSEPFTATFIGIITLQILNGKAKSLLTIFSAALLPPLIALLLLKTAMPWPLAFKSTLGSWPWLMASRITSLPFYRRVSGLNDIAGNLKTLAIVFAGYAISLAIFIALSLRNRRTSKSLGFIFFGIVAIALCVSTFQTFAYVMIRPMGFLLLAILVVLCTHRTRMTREAFAIATGVVIFSGVMMLKISLTTGVFHYGFALAMPGTIVLVVFGFAAIPGWIRQRGGNPFVFLGAMLAVWVVGIGSVLSIDANFYAAKTFSVGTGGDAFRTDENGRAAAEMLALIEQKLQPGDSIAVFPQGLMLNYLSRRINPLHTVNFMPPEVIAEGEDSVFRELVEHPPDAIVLNVGSIRLDQFTLDEDYLYGGKVCSLILRDYTPIGHANHLVLLKHH